ncbi:MAG: single-stranded DNA-binding protein [Chloroflexi bacterium]|nr:single-stranded DNA-binding protein [Chloroflexota bacterium]
MKKGLNKVMLIGWVDDEPEVRHTPTGRPVASFSLATSRSWTSSEGDHHEETEWFNIVAWGSLAELCEKRLGREHQVYVEGRLQTRGWEDNQGRHHFRTEVVAHELIVLTNTMGEYHE